MKVETKGKMQIALTPLLADADGVGQMLGVSRAMVFNMHSDGRLGPLPVKLGTRTLWRTDELSRWVAARCPRRERWLEVEKVVSC